MRQPLKVSQKFDIDPGSLAAANGLNVQSIPSAGPDSLIPPGQRRLSHGQARGVPSGKSVKGIGVDASLVLEENGIGNPAQIQEGQKLFLPGARPKKNSVDFIWPVRGRLTSGYGYRQHPMGGQSKFHCGIDIAAPVGRTINAARDGKVTCTGRRGSLGLAVTIQHDDGYSTVYGHASSILVRGGQQVRQGDPIALVGNSGLSTGPHLHFEIRKSGRAINPRPLLP
jgi:murein DD-endopeptidase MepM/ murein hydrolase activator NlpD